MQLMVPFITILSCFLVLIYIFSDLHLVQVGYSLLQMSLYRNCVLHITDVASLFQIIYTLQLNVISGRGGYMGNRLQDSKKPLDSCHSTQLSR